MCTRARTSLQVLMFPSCVPPANNISFKRNRKNLPALSLPPIIPCALLPRKKNPPLATQCNQDTRVYNSFLYGSGSGNGGKQTCELSVNHIKQQATIMCFLSPFLGGVHMEKRPKTANNAAIQQSFYCICSRNGVKYEILS